MTQKTLGLVLAGFALILIVLLGVVKVNFDQQGIFLCEAVEANPSLTMAQCPAHTSSVPTLLMLAFGVSSVILAVGLYLLFIALASKKAQKEHAMESATQEMNDVIVQRGDEIDIANLSEEEKQVYSLLKENKGSLYQSDIVKQSGLSKVKVTRILDSLEHDRKIIERKRRGMANIVVLK